MSLPFGLKAPSKGTLIFSGVAGAISGLIYTSNKHAEESRKRLTQRVSFLAERPCGIHETPRKVLVYISAPPGDSLEKSRNWFREYVKPVLVAGAVDYEVKEAKSAGQIESSVMKDIIQFRRQALEEAEKSTTAEDLDRSVMDNAPKINSRKPFPSPVLKKPSSSTEDANKDEYDGILAIGRNAYREVLNGLSKGCDADPFTIEETKTEEVKPDESNKSDENKSEESKFDEEIKLEQDKFEENTLQTNDVDHFSLPSKFSPVMYIPHVNIIGWSNIPYRLYMWCADYKRIDDIGNYVVAVVLNQTRPVEKQDADKGQHEKKYWIGDEEVEELAKNDPPIEIDERIIDKLTTYITE